MPNLPDKILLYRSKNEYYPHLKQLLKNWKIDFIEAGVMAEINGQHLLEDIPIVMAIADQNDVNGIEFLRSVMQANNWIQRMMLTTHADPEIYERAVNKAHINYLIQIPVESEKLATYLRKSFQRYEQITRPFAKFDALASITTDILAENEKFRVESATDPLTKLMNRRSFNKILQRIWQRFKDKEIPFSIAILDIDHFKKVNDTFGHVAGDKVLQKIAEMILINQRIGMDYAFRYGGEEFAIVSSNTNAAEMETYVNRLLQSIRETVISFEDDEIQVTFSAGICQAAPDLSAEDLVKQADEALYKAKDSGRNLVLIHDSVD